MNEVIPSAEPNEIGHAIETDYEQSVQKLFDLLPAASDGSMPYTFFTVEWDRLKPGRIAEMHTMTATPTGARKEERWGVFYRAQFYVTERSHTTGEGREGFAWYYTGPQAITTPIRIEPEALAQEHNYQTLTPESAVWVLTQQADTVDDYVALIQAMCNRHIPPIPELATGINRMLRQLVHSLADPYNPEGTKEREEILTLVSIFRSLDANVSKATQGYLISQLLYPITQQLLAPSPLSKRASDRAATVLEATIAHGLMPNEPRIMHRVLACSPMYVYPFATELLHTQLQRSSNRGSTTNIFSVNRSTFVHNYITAVLQGNSFDPSPQLNTLLQTSYVRLPTADSRAQLHMLLHNLLTHTDGAGASLSTQKHAASIESTFAHILSKLRRTESPNEAQAALDQKCIEVVKMVLAPLRYGQIGDQIIANTLVSPEED